MTERLPFVALTPEQTNAALLDKWSFVHGGTGLAAGLVGLNAWVFIGLSVLYEVVEYAHESPSGSKLFGTKRPESKVNMVADLALNCAGYAVGAWAVGQKPKEAP